jgi:hypothetical protein
MIRTAMMLALAIGALAPASARAQLPIGKDQPDQPVDAKTAVEVAEGAVKLLNASYVFPETARKMDAAIRARIENKEYESITSAKELARTLTDHLQAVSKDKHLRVFYTHDPVPEPPKDDVPPPAMRERMRAQGEALNYGFEKVDRLEGNVGYIVLRGFHPAEFGGETAAAAMNLVANADALIIDIRKNGGGAPSMVALICSYLFGPEPVHLNDLYHRPDDSTHQWWTLPHVPGRRFEGKPVYVLTSRRTFSAAEEFAYNLKNLKRATLVGETTGGGAHPGGVRRITANFALFVPTGRAINPISKTNWEGTGVEPDVAVPAELALKTAHLAALTECIKGLEARLDDSKEKAEATPLHRRKLEMLKTAAEQVRKELDGLKKAPKAEDASASNGGA